MSKSPLFAKGAAINDDAETVWDRKLAELNEHRVATVLEILELEKAGASPGRDPTATLDERVAAFLGDAPKAPRKVLGELYLDRLAIEKAWEIASGRATVEHGRRVEARVEQNMPLWRDIVKRRVLAVAALQRVNAEADDFAIDMQGTNGPRPILPLGGFTSAKLLGNGRVQVGPAQEFIEAAVKAGIVSKGEVKNA